MIMGFLRVVVPTSMTSMIIIGTLGLNFILYRRRRALESKMDKLRESNKMDELRKSEMDNLREFLSCQICLEVCFEPCMNHCGHNLCRKCLVERCPTCGEVISHGGTVNNAEWRLIQELFPLEVEARKAAERATTQKEDEDATLAMNESNKMDELRKSEMDKLREVLSCPICLEVCFEPCINHCGHNLCRKCLAERCPTCGEVISHGGTVNDAEWRLIQNLFPLEVEARKAAERATTQKEEADATCSIICF